MSKIIPAPQPRMNDGKGSGGYREDARRGTEADGRRSGKQT